MKTFLSKWVGILFQIPQDSFLGLFLFNILMCDLSTIIDGTITVNYTGRNTPYVLGETPRDIINSLETC